MTDAEIKGGGVCGGDSEICYYVAEAVRGINRVLTPPPPHPLNTAKACRNQLNE